MKSFDVVVLNRARTTFQRVADAKFFNGWIRNISPDTVVVHTCTSCPIKPGDKFAFQVYGNKKDAFFRASLMTLQGASQAPVFGADRMAPSSIELACRITTEMEFHDGLGQPRFCVEGAAADLRHYGELLCIGCPVIDVGPAGFAVISDATVTKGDFVDVSISARSQLIQCRAEVRNCVVSALNSRFHRVGFQMREMDRVDALRWKQLYLDILESNKMLGLGRSVEIGTTVKLRPKHAA